MTTNTIVTALGIVMILAGAGLFAFLIRVDKPTDRVPWQYFLTPIATMAGGVFAIVAAQLGWAGLVFFGMVLQ